MKPRTYADLRDVAEHMTGRDGVGFKPSSLPIKEIALAIASRGEELGLIWRLVPATVAQPGPGGVMRVILDGDTVAIDAVTMIGRLPVGGRVFVILSPPAGVHIVGFLGYDFPQSVPGEAIGRPRLITTTVDFPSSSTTVAPVTALAFTVVANGVYEIRLRASVSGTAAATGGKLNWDIPSGSTDRYIMGLPHNGASPVTDQFDSPRYQSGRRSATTEQGMATVGASSFTGYWEDVQLRVGATGGTVTPQFARVAGAGTATLRQQSYLIVQRFR